MKPDSPRKGKRARRPEDIHDRPTALTKRQQQEQADARVQGAKQAQLATSKGQAKLATSERAREPARKADKYRRDVRRQVANPSIADRVASGLFKGAASGLGLDQLVDDAIWSFTNPVDRVTNKGRSAGEQQMIYPGFGKTPRPTVKTGPRIGPPTLHEHVVEQLPEAQKLRVKQEAGYAKEKGQRILAADEARVAAGGGVEGYHAALRELRGELPKLRFGALEDLNPRTVDRLMDHIASHPDLANRRWDMISAQRALKNVVEGRVPTRGDIQWLQKMFGTETAQDVVQNVTGWQKAKEGALNILNIPRALKSSMDISAPFRQGLVLGARHPVIFARAWRPMLKSFAKEGAYEDAMRGILSRPNAQLYADAKLALTDLEGGLALREEAFMSQIAEVVPGVRHSGRAYTTFLNRMRADAFDHYVNAAKQNGKEFSPQELKDIARWINNATGRGGGKNKMFQDSLTALNVGLFSPRLMASRVNLLNPVFYAQLSPFARRQALRGAAQLAGAVSMTLWLAKLGGADVELDPRSSDFGKIKIGDTRIDIAGGFTQYMTFAARQVTGQSVVDGEVVPLGPGFGSRSRLDVAERFARSKASPLAAYGYDALQGQTFDFRPFDPAREFGRMFLPIGFESVYDTHKEAGPRVAAGSFGLNAVGFGVQTYGPDEPEKSKSKGSPYVRRDSGSRSPYVKSGKKARSPYVR